MNIEQLLANEAAAAESNPDAPLRPETRVTRGNSRSETLQVRLNPDEMSALARAAAAKGVPTSTLARDLLLRSLATSGDSPQAAIARLRADLDALDATLA